MLGPEPRDVSADLRIIPVPLEKFTYLGAGMAEQRLVDELDGCGGALDVQQDRADALQLDVVRTGMYVGPRQSGWYPVWASLLV